MEGLGAFGDARTIVHVFHVAPPYGVRSGTLEIILDLPFGFPINNIISL